MKVSMNEILASNTNCTGIIIPEIGHGISLANPILFNTLIENWLEHDILPENLIIVN